MLCAVLSLPTSAVETTYHGSVTSETIWTKSSDSGKYPRHRIPGVVVTKNDTVIIYCEARTGDTSNSLKENNDWCLMDIYIQRSTDGGKTFGDPIYIAKGNSTTATVNNPVMIVGEDNTLHMLYCKNYSIKGGGIWYRYSTDDGLTWSEEKEMSEFVDVEHSSFAFGPTHGICTSDGTLMAPVWYVPAGEEREGEITAHNPSKAAIFYSKDNGKTWALGETASNNSSESSIAELSDGSIIMNSRSTPYRKVSVSKNGINAWSTTYADTHLPDPGCCGSLISADLGEYGYALLFVNCASSSEREKVTVRVSFDDGDSWTKIVTLTDSEGGYADIAVDSKGKVYVLYENDFGAAMKLATFSLADTLDLSNTDVETTNIVFDTAQSLERVTYTKNLNTEHVDGALKLTATNTKNYFVELNLASGLKNISVSKYKAVAVRVRANAANKEKVMLGASFCCTNLGEATNYNLATASVTNNGEWQTIVFDLSNNPNIGGSLYSIYMELNSDTGKGAVGDTLEISSITFYTDTDSVIYEAIDTATQTDITTEAQAETEDKASGCSSFTAASVLVVAVCAVTAISLQNKKRKTIKRH